MYSNFDIWFDFFFFHKGVGGCRLQLPEKLLSDNTEKLFKMNQSKPIKAGQKRRIKISDAQSQKLTSMTALFAMLNNVCCGGPPVSAIMKMSAKMKSHLNQVVLEQAIIS